MKALILAIFLIICLITPAKAVTMDNLPVVCDESKMVYESLKKKKFEPVMIGETGELQSIVFLNPDADMVFAFSIVVEGKQMTCIFLAGDHNTQIFDLRKKDTERQKQF